MVQKLLETIKRWSEEGMRLPVAYDADLGKPSVTLMFAWVAFFLAVGSTIALNFTQSVLSASLVSIMFWVLAVVIYRLRKLDHVKFDLDDKEIELSSEDEEPKK